MKIDNNFKAVPAPLTNRPPAKPVSDQTATAAQVSLSSLAGTLQGGERPPVNAARIQEIKEAISQGKFKINPEAIADRLLDSARDLINSQRQA
jgi:negative regulator of flagellin synthesis FlgM